MANRIPRKCVDPRCKKVGVFEYGRCPEHRRENDRTRHSTHPARSEGATWQRFREYLASCGNVICQRVRGDGTRCKNPVVIFHHIIPAELRLDLAYEWQNVVGVCRSCHPRPDDEDQGEYVPTLWRTPMSEEPMPSLVVMPGALVTLGTWTLENRFKALYTHTGYG